MAAALAALLVSAGLSAAPAHAPRVGDAAAYERLAGPDGLYFVVDAADGDRVYFVDSKRYPTPYDFLGDAYLSLETGHEFNENTLSADEPRFLMGTVLRGPRPGGYLMTFWGDPEARDEAKTRARAAVAGAFFAPVAPGSGPAGPEAYQEINPGRAVGRLRLAGESAPPGGPASPDDIVVVRRLGAELPDAAAVLVLDPVTSLAHACVLARGLGVAMAYAPDAARLHGALSGSLVALEIGRGSYSLRPATEAERAASGARRPAARRVAAPSDLSFRELTGLADQRGADSVRFGAKSANLGELARAAGAPWTVPPGFSIPFFHYGAFLRDNGLAETIRPMLADDRLYSDAAHRRRVLDGLRGRIKAGRASPALERLLAERLRRDFPARGVFVRSSTNAEDLPGFTGAGLYDTVPNVRGAAAVLDAVKTVWASAWSDRAFEARERYGMDHASVMMGVLVQEGVDADAAGVLATSGAGGSVRVAAKRGLGIRVVEGGARAEELLVDPSDGSVRLVGPNADPARLQFSPQGGVRALPSAPGRVLPDGPARELARAALRIESLLGAGPLEIDWLIKNGRVHVLQARPLPPAVGQRK